MKAKQVLIDFLNNDEFEMTINEEPDSEEFNSPFHSPKSSFTITKVPMKYKNGYSLFVESTNTNDEINMRYVASVSLENDIYYFQHSALTRSFGSDNHYIDYEQLLKLLFDFEGKNYYTLLEENDRNIDSLFSIQNEEKEKIQEKWNKELIKEYDYQNIKNNTDLLYCDLKNPTEFYNLKFRDLVSACSKPNLSGLIEERIKLAYDSYKKYYFSILVKKDFAKEIETNPDFEAHKAILNGPAIGCYVYYRMPDGSIDEKEVSINCRFNNDKPNPFRQNFKQDFDNLEYNVIDGVLIDAIEKIEYTCDDKGMALDTNKVAYDKPISISLKELTKKWMTNEHANIELEDCIRPFKKDKEIAEIAFLQQPRMYMFFDSTLKKDTTFLLDLLHKCDKQKLDLAMNMINDTVFFNNKDFTIEVLELIKNDTKVLQPFIETNLSEKNVDEKLINVLMDEYDKMKYKHISLDDVLDDDINYYLDLIWRAIAKNPKVLEDKNISEFVKDTPIESRMCLLESTKDFDLLTKYFTLDELAENMEQLNDEILNDENIVKTLLGSQKAHPLVYVNDLDTLKKYKHDPDIVKLIGLTAKSEKEAFAFIRCMELNKNMEYLQELMCNNYFYFEALNDEHKKIFIESESSSIESCNIKYSEEAFNNIEFEFKTINGIIKFYETRIEIMHDKKYYEYNNNVPIYLLTNESDFTNIVYQSAEEFINNNSKFNIHSKNYQDFFNQIYDYVNKHKNSIIINEQKDNLER